jgi:DNA-binding SARP family transcriptional activator
MKKVTERTRLALLGSWQLEVDGQARSGPSYKKGLALLAYLAIGKGPQSREAISSLLWPDSAGHLRQVLSNLRSTLDIGHTLPCLLSEGGALALNPQYPLWVDVSAFNEPLACHADSSPEHCAGCLNGMERKAALYRGEFMTGFAMPECEAFEDWLQQQRETLRSRMLTLLERLWQCHEQHGKPEKALSFAQRYVEMEAWNEAGQRHLIHLLALTGQPAAALSQFETCRRLLDRELGVLPEQETLTLVEQIRAGDFAPSRPKTSLLPPEANEPVSEHRLLTMLYCRLDAPGVEDLDDLAEALMLPQQQSEAIIARHCGHIVQSQRHGILACFGFPLARENAARHALRAALSIRDAMPATIASRIGIHSGMVIAQNNIPDIMGMTAAYATSMAESAEAGTVLISEITKRLTMGYFRLHPIGTQSRQGMAKPLTILRVEAESGANSRLESAEQLTPLVGRSTELAQLQACWKQAQQGMGQTVLIRGDAGIGKSRLVHDFAAQLSEPVASRELRCFPEFSQSPLHPVLALCESLCGFGIGDSEPDKFEKLSAYLLEQHPALADEALELLAALLHLPTKTTATLPPQTQKQRTTGILLDLLHNLAARQPLLLIIEDLHWCDPSTLELLEAHARQHTAPILTLLTARPEFRLEPKPGGTLDLAPLSVAEVTELIEHLETGLPEAAILGIAGRTDGIPLFAEEMARASQIQLANQGAPLTLRELLTARLDSAGEAKATAWLAATLGREFDPALLRRISPLTQDAFELAIETLLDTGLIHGDHDQSFAFRHALIQEAAYQTQPKKSRQAAHRRIAEVLQTAFPETTASQPEIVARHLTEGGETLAAIGYWLKAGHNAVLYSAHLEARAHFETGLSVLEQLSDDETRNRLELQLQAAVGGVLIALKGYGSEDAKRHFTRAAYLGRGAGDEEELFPIIYGLWLGGQSDSITVAPLDLAEKLMHIAQRSGKPVHLIAAHYAHGNNLFWLGRHREARAHLETVLSAFPEITSERLIAELGEDTRVSCRSFLAWVEWLQGYPDRARRQIEIAISEATALDHAHSQGFALAFSATLYRHLGLPCETEAISLELLKLAEHRELGLWTAVAYTAQGWAMVAQGNAEAIHQVEQSVMAVRVAMKLVDATISLYLADGLIRLGRHQQALECLENIISQALDWQDRYLLAEFYRLKAEAMLATVSDCGEEVEVLLLQALETARQQQSVMLELRSVIVLAQLWRNNGNSDQAHALLNEVYRRFSEGFDIPDLQTAAALLQELTS